MPEGDQVKVTLLANQTLGDLIAHIMKNRSYDNDEFSLLIPFPRKEYTSEQFEGTTLLQAGLAPRGTLTLQKLKSKGVVTKGDGQMVTHNAPGGYNDDYDEDDEENDPTYAPPTGGRTIGAQDPMDLTDPDQVPLTGSE